MIRFSPLLNFKEFWGWLTVSPSMSFNLEGYGSEVWTQGGAEGISLVCSWLSVASGKSINVLIPGYFCGQSLRFLRTLNVNMIFYPVTDELLPDYQEISNRIDGIKIDLFVHVHYFGNTKGGVQSANFASSIGAKLLEDAAHVLSPRIVDWVGDFVVFAPHKHFAIPKVGLVLVKDNSKSLKSSWAPKVKADIALTVWFGKQLLKHLGWPSAISRWGVISGDPKESLGRQILSQKHMSIAMGNYEKYLPTALIKSDNARVLLDRLLKVDKWMPLQEYRSFECPYIVGMVCESMEIAERRFLKLNENSRLVMQWPDVPSEIKIDKKVADQSQLLVETTLFFTIHQQIYQHDWLGLLESIITRENF
jgi:hypothetical protein